MNAPQAHLPDCPNCGAPLDLRRVRNGAVDCPYCGMTIALRSLPSFAADPKAVEELERRAAPPTLAASLFGRVAQQLAVPVAFGAAWSLVATWFVFLRNPHEFPFLWTIVAALVAFFVLAWKRRLAAIALTVVVGGLTALKPFLQPIVDTGGYAERDDSDDMFDDCVVWLLDLRTRKPLLRAPVPTLATDYFRLSADMLTTLQEATGGTFQRSRS